MTTPEWQPPAPAEFAGIVSRAAALLVDVGVLLVIWAVLRALPVSGGLGNAVVLVGVAASRAWVTRRSTCPITTSALRSR